MKKIRQQIEMSGKRTFVAYKGKDKRTSFDESLAQKKMDLINSVVVDQADAVIKVLNK